MSCNNPIRPRGRGRGSFRLKYTRSNLHVIATHIPAAPISISKKKPFSKNTKKGTILESANNKSPSKSSSLKQENKPSTVTNKDTGLSKTESGLSKAKSCSPKADSVLIKKESELPKAESVVEKKESEKSTSTVLSFISDTTRKERQANYAKANFLLLNNLDKNTPKRKTARPKNVFIPKVVQNVYKNVLPSQTISKPIKKEPVQMNKFIKQDLLIKPDEPKKGTPPDQKMKPSPTKFPSGQELNKNEKNSSFPTHPKADKPEGKKKKVLNKDISHREKELLYHEEEFTGGQKRKKKAGLDSSTIFETHKIREPFLWDEGSISGEDYFRSEQEKIASRKKSRTSKEYSRSLEEEMYYKNKYKKSKEKDYKCKESEPYPTYDKYNWLSKDRKLKQKQHEKSESGPINDKYSWFSKDYKLKQKHSEELHAFNKYSDYPLEEGDFEEVEDFEEVASVESKVPVRFHKCVVRYLPYRTFSYFRPKWYYLSRKRYIVNCMYASGKEGKINIGKEKDTKKSEKMLDVNSLESGMEVPEEECLDNFEMLEVIPDDDDVAAEEVSVHDDETISDVSILDGETISDEVSVHDDSVEKDISVTKKEDMKSTSLNKDIEAEKEDIKSASLNQGFGEKNEAVKSSDVKLSSNQGQTVKNTGNQVAQKTFAPQKLNSIPVIDLCGDSPKTKIMEKSETVKNMDIQVINLEEDTIQEKSEKKLEKNIKTDPSTIKKSMNDRSISPSKKFLKCNSSLAFTSDFKQGVALIQNTLAKWKSHLIGLEYVLEIRASLSNTIAKKYHCGLCDEDIPVENIVEQIVINHVISYKHMCNYVAKHFPSSDYKFSKSVRSYFSEIVLRKFCEEINYKLGYYFMCIVKEDYFQKQGNKVKEHLDSMKHFSEADINIDTNIILNRLESDIQKDVTCLIDDVMCKILINEKKYSFFTPKTIVSISRRSNVKDKKKELSMVFENALSRSSQNALILLTPEHDPLQSPEVISVKTTLADHKAPETLVSASKISRELQRSSNLLQVHVLDETNKQPLGAASNFNSVKIYTPEKKVTQQKNESVKEESHLENIMSVNPNAKNKDPGVQSSFKFDAEKFGSFTKSKAQESASTPVPKIAGSEKEAVRIVRIKTLANRSVKLKFDEEDEDTPVFLLDSNVHAKQESEIVPPAENDPELFKKESINTGEADTLQGEDISDKEFSDNDFVDMSSTIEGASTHKSRSRVKQHSHQKGPHSKFCRKRIYRGKESSTDQDSALNDLNVSGNVIPMIDKFKGKHYSTFVKRSDELSLDSSISSGSRRKTSPLRLSRSPSLEELLRKLSRSPKRSKSPLRSYRKRGSSIRRHSRSPYRRYSRSPRKRRSRSPYRKRSRSPIRRRSRSPFRKRSRTPPRKHSRSPTRRRSRSPYKRHSRSPRRRISRSPKRKRSKSPIWSVSKGRAIHKSRSPFRKSGGRKISRSPERIPIKLSTHNFSKSPTRRSKSPSSTYPHSRSPIRSDSRLSKDSLSYKSDSFYKYKKESSRTSGSFESTSKSSIPHHRKESEMGRDIDLEEVSDEDESKYFNTSSDNPVYMEIIKKLPESARIMLVKVLQRFSITNINPNDPSFFELMKFVASHSSEIQRLMSQPSVFSEMNPPMQGNPVQSQESLVHEYLLSGMKGNFKNVNPPIESFPSTSGTPSVSADIRFQQQPMPSASGLQFIPPSSNLPPNQFQPSGFQQLSSQPQYPMPNLQRPVPPQVHPQQMYVNPPVVQQPRILAEKYQTPSPQKPVTAPQKKAQSEVMFKDLKATVNKIFGGDDVLGRIGIKIPGFNDAPVQDKWGINPSSVPKSNPETQTSFQGNRSGMNFHNMNEDQTRANDNILKNYSKIEEPYFEEMSRQEPHVPPPDAKVSFCDVQRPSQKNLFPVVNNPDISSNYSRGNTQMSVNDAKKSLAQRLAAVLVKVGMTDVPAYLLQEMLMKIGAFSLNPPQDISEEEIIGILRKLKYL